MTETPPQELDEFLLWFRAKSEAHWETCPMPSLQEQIQAGVGGMHWRRGTKWKAPLSSADIEAVEARYKVTFPSPYKSFLQTLNTPDQGMLSYSFKQLGNRLAQDQDVHLFPDWTGNETSTRDQLNWPFDGWIFDLEHDQGWFDVMGPKPDALKDQIAVVKGLLERAPPLIPVYGHRYMAQSGVILSVHQTDVIVYAPSLQDYLLREFSGIVGSFPTRDVSESTYESARHIPVWGMLL